MGHVVLRVNFHCLCCQSHFLPTIKTSGCHYHLGHPSFSTLKSMFPSLFQGLDIGVFHCDDCEFAKQKHVSFPWYIVMFGVHPTFQIYPRLAGLSFLLMILLGYLGCIS